MTSKSKMIQKIALRGFQGLFFLASCLLHPASSFGQSPVNVTATVKDSAGIPYSNATVSILLIPTGTAPTVGGAQISGTNNGQLDVNGKLNVSLYKNTDIVPASSQWQFTICETPGVAPPLGTGGQCFTSSQTVSAAVDFSTQFQAAAKALSTVTLGAGSVTHTGGALTANLPVIGAGGADIAVGTRTGNTTQYPTWTGATTVARCVDTDASGNLQITSSDCGGGVFPLTVSGTVNSGGIPCFTSTTNEASSALLVQYGILQGGGAGVCPSTLSPPTTPNSVPYILTSTPSGGLGTASAWGLSGIAARAVTGVTATDTITSTDCNNDVDYQGSVSVNPVTVPTATTLGIAGCVLVFHNDTVGPGTTLTITPTAWQVKVNGAGAAANFTLAIGQRARMIVDAAGSLWDAEVIDASSITGSVTSVAHTMPTQFTVTGSPVTVSGTLADTYLDPNKNLAIDVLTPFETLQSQRRTSTILAQGQGSYNVMGDTATETSTASTNVAPTASAPVQSEETTTGTISTAAGLAGIAIHRTGRTHGITLIIGSKQNVTTNDRTTRCLTDQTLATQVGSDVPAGNYACITYSTTGTYTGLTDTTHYVVLTKDNTTQNAVATTVLADTAYHVFGIREDIPNSSYHFYIDFVEVGGTGITAHIPTPGTNMRYVSAVWNLAASTVLLDNGIVQIVEDK